MADARDAAMKARVLIRDGIDPVAQKHQEKQQAILKATVASVRTFRHQAEQYIEVHASGWKNAKHKQQWENTLEQYVYPVFGAKDVADIVTDDVLKVLKPIWNTKNETASRIRNRIELILNAARAMGLRTETNPALWRGHLDALLPKPSKVHTVRNHPAMPWQELPRFWKTLSGHQGVSVNALKFTILTGSRTSEVTGARWDEFDLKSKTWSIPAERMKANKPHVVPLSDAALKVLDTQRGKHAEWVFPGQRKKNPLSNMGMLMLVRDIAPSYTVHGFRSTFRVWGAEQTSFPHAVLEMALAHVIPNATEAAYQRSDLLNKRRDLIDEWAAFVTEGHANAS